MWIICFIEILLFDVLWCVGTTFRGMHYPSTYVGAIFFAFLMVLPWMLTRRVWVQMLCLLIGNVWMIANLMYCRTYMQAIPLNSYLLVGNLADFTDSVVDQLRWYDALLPLTTIGFWCTSKRWINKWCVMDWRKYAKRTGAAACLFVLVALCHGGFNKHMTNLYNSTHIPNNPTLYYGLAANLIYQYFNASDRDVAQDLSYVQSWLDEHDRLCPLPSLGDSIGRRSIVLVFLESFESWVLEKEVQGQELTPLLNALLRDSTTFYAPRVLTQASSGRSIEGQLLVNAGLLPMKDEVYSMQYANQTYPSLTQAVKERSQREGANCRALLLTPDKPHVWNQRIIARSYGFDSLIMKKDWVDTLVIRKLADKAIFTQSVDKLSSGIWPEGQDAFIQVLSYTGHNPFTMPDKLKYVHFSDMPTVLNDFMSVANYTDASLAPFIEYLQSREDYKDMLVVITGDHEGLAADRKPLLQDKLGRQIVDPEQYVPLIILNAPVPGRYDEVMGQADIYPTLLQMMGLTEYYWHGVGESVLNPERATFAISSMTNRILGDTTNTVKFRHMREARTVSDLIIRDALFDSIAPISIK